MIKVFMWIVFAATVALTILYLKRPEQEYVYFDGEFGLIECELKSGRYDCCSEVGCHNRGR